GAAMANSDLMVFQRLVVNCYAERRADLILPRITFADIAAVVEERSHAPGRLQALLDALGHLDHVGLVARQWNDGNLYRREIRVQMQNRSLLAAFKLLLLVSIHQERERDAIHAARRLDHIWRYVLV